MASCTCLSGRTPLQTRSVLSRPYEQHGLKQHINFAYKQARPQRSRPSRSVRVFAEEAPEKLSGVKEGTRVRVTRSLPVYHAMKFKEGLDLEGKEGEVLSDVSQWKGKTLSSTLPYRIQFMIPHEQAGEVKVIAHLNGTEFEPL